MIHGYGDHAANELTFLAWVCTGVAVIAFGFVVEKCNIFVTTIAYPAPWRRGAPIPIRSTIGTFGGVA